MRGFYSQPPSYSLESYAEEKRVNQGFGKSSEHVAPDSSKSFLKSGKLFLSTELVLRKKLTTVDQLSAKHLQQIQLEAHAYRRCLQARLLAVISILVRKMTAAS